MQHLSPGTVIDLTTDPASLQTSPPVAPETDALRQEILDTLHEFASDKRSMAPAPRRPATTSRAGYYVAAGRRVPSSSASDRRPATVVAAAPARRAGTRWEAAHQIALALGSRR